jgi:hypothetical protein
MKNILLGKNISAKTSTREHRGRGHNSEENH